MAKADILPMGSLVYLKGGDMKLMVIARGPVFEDDKGETVYADYLIDSYQGTLINRLIWKLSWKPCKRTD